MKLIYGQVLRFSFTVCISVQINVVMRNSSGKQYFMIYSGWLKHIRKLFSFFFYPLLPAFLLGPLSIRARPWLLNRGRCFISAGAQMADDKEQTASIGGKQSGGSEPPYPPCLKECFCLENKKKDNAQKIQTEHPIPFSWWSRINAETPSWFSEMFPWQRHEKKKPVLPGVWKDMEGICTLNSV